MGAYAGLPRVTWWVWKAQFRAIGWVLKRYWPATALGVGGLIGEVLSVVEPAGAGASMFLGWMFMAMFVAMDRAGEVYEAYVEDFAEGGEA